MAQVRTWRLKKVLSKLVGPNKHAFIHGRQICDASLIANEYFNIFYLKADQPPTKSCKPDVEKDYDCVS